MPINSIKHPNDLVKHSFVVPRGIKNCELCVCDWINGIFPHECFEWVNATIRHSKVLILIENHFHLNIANCEINSRLDCHFKIFHMTSVLQHTVELPV